MDKELEKSYEKRIILYGCVGTGMSCKEKNRKENLQMCLSLSLFIIAKLSLKSESLLLFKLN